MYVRRRDHRFVVRFWQGTSGSQAAWRGSVYDVSSALTITSGKPSDLWDFIMLRLGQNDD